MVSMSIGNVAPNSHRPEAELSLPPQVTGLIKGESLLHISGLKLADGRHEGQTLQVRVQWWGDTGAGTLLQIRSGSGTTAARFPIRCSARHFQQYLQDMEWLALALEDRFNGMLGEAALAVSELTEQRPLAGALSFVQWLGSGENKIVATAQLKLLLSFTTIPALACTAAPSVASDSGYDSSCSSSSSQDSLCSNDKSSAMMPSRLETAQEGPDSRESSHAEPRQASQLPASREPRQDRSGSLKRRQQQQHASESQEHVQRLPAKPTAALDSAASQLSAAPPHAAKMALGDEAKAAAKEAAEGSRQDKPAPAAGTTGEGEAPGLSPEEALSRLIHRAEQLRQMIAGAPADSSSSSAAIAKTGTETFQHCIKSDADVFSAPTAGHEGLGADTSLPAMSSTNTDKQHTRHSTTPAGNSTATGDTDSGNPIVDSTEQTQSSISMDSAPTSVKQKTMNDRVLPVSKLRKVAQGRSGSVAKDRTLSPQKTAASSLPKDSVAATGAPRPGHSRRPYKDAACQTTPAAALPVQGIAQLSKSSSSQGLPTADAPLNRPAPSQDSAVQTVGRLQEPLRQLQHLPRKPPRPQTSQEGLLRSHSAPALSGDTLLLLATSEESQPSAQTHRDPPGQHGAPDTLVTAMQHSRTLSSRPRKKVQRSREPKAPSIHERQVWCNTFKPARQLPAGHKPRESNKLPFSSANGGQPHSSVPMQRAPGLQALPSERPAQLLTTSAGFHGRPAKAIMQIASARIPCIDPPLRDRSTYSVMYRLPGDAALQLTPRVEAQASANLANFGNELRVTFNHASVHWVMADESLAQRLLSTPMLATVLLHPCANQGEACPQPVPVGTAEMDLSNLLLPRLSTVRAALRAVMSTYPLIHPGAESVHGASITIKVSLNMDPPNAQQALPELQRAVMPETSMTKPGLQNLGLGKGQEHAGKQVSVWGFTQDLQGNAEARRQGSLRPVTAETSTEYFARMEACSVQPTSAHGTASKGLGVMHELGSSSSGQSGRYEQPEDLLAAWRQLSDSMPPGRDNLEDTYTCSQLDSELELNAGLAASWMSPEQLPLQAPLADDPLADTYTSAAWDISDSPSMLMGSPEQSSQHQLPYSDSARTWLSSHFPESPEQLPQYRTGPPVLEGVPAHAAHPLSSSLEHGFFSDSLGIKSPEGMLHAELSETQCGAEPGYASGVKLNVEAGVSEQGFGEPSEEDLYLMMARFQENCSQLPAEHDSHADLAAMLPLGSHIQLVEQQDASSPDDLNHSPLQAQNTLDHTPPQQEVSAVADHAFEAEQGSSSRAAMYMDCLEPDEAARTPLTGNTLHTERLATCSDDEEFAVLDFGGPSGGSSECSFGPEGTACHENVYSAPRGALIMPGAFGASDEWLFGISATLPEACPSAPDAPEVHGLALGTLGAGHFLDCPGLAPRHCMTPASGEGPAQQKGQASFSFTNMLPPVPADQDTEQDDASSERSLLEAFSVASSPKPEQAANASCQPHRDTDASGSEPYANIVTEQPVSAGAAEHAVAAAQHDLDFDVDCLLLSSISLCSPSSCQPPPFLEAAHVSEPVSLSGQPQPASSEEAAPASMPSQQPAQPEHSSASALFVSVLPQPDGEPSAHSNSQCPVLADRVAAAEQQPPSNSLDERAAFSNVLPCVDEQPSMHSSSLDSITRTDDVDKQQGSAQPTPNTGMSRREVFRQKLAAAQAARLGSTVQPAPAASRPEVTDTGIEHKRTGSPSMEEHQSNGSMSPLQEAPPHAADADAQHSIGESSEPALAPGVPATSPSSAPATDGYQTHVPAGDGLDTSMPDEESSIASSEPEQAPLGTEDHADKTSDGSKAGMQWADNAAAGESNGEHEEPSDVAIRRMSAVARQGAQAPAPQQSTTLSDAAAAHTSEALHGAHEEASNAGKAQSSLSSPEHSPSGMATMPIEAAVHWADNAASVGAAAEASEEPDEALLQAIRRMSVVAREHALGHSPVADTSLSAAGLDQTGNITPSNLQHRTQQHDGLRGDSTMVPRSYGSFSPVSMSEPGSGQSGQGSMPTSLVSSTSATSSVHPLHAEQSSSSPVRASYEQLLSRFKGSPAPKRCFTPPPCSQAQAVAEQYTGPEAAHSSASEDAVTGSGQPPRQLGSPQWQHGSPLPICSPVHAYMAGQTSPPGALGARLRDLEPRQVLPALRAIWGHDQEHPPRAEKLARATETASVLDESRGRSKAASGAAKAALADTETALRMTLRMTKDNGGVSIEGARPAARRGSFDPEAERIAEIMASVRASPWQHRQDIP